MTSLALLEQVTYTYPDASRAALRDVSLTIGPAEVVLVLGGSGSGKSTLLRCLNGLVPHFHGGTFAGRVTVTGLDTRTAPARQLARRVGLAFQDPESQAVMTTVERELAFGLENVGVPGATITRLVEEALISAGLSHLRHATLAELSGGELQRVALASIIAMQPSVLALDEPTSQLDPVSSEDLLASVRRVSEDTGATIILAEHRVERCLHLATRVIVLEDGALARDDEPAAFARWAAIHRPAWLTPVGRLFSRRPGAAFSGGAGQRALPCTVKDARALLSTGGPWRAVSAPAVASVTPGEVILRAEGLTVGYDRDWPLVEGLSLELRRGEVVALMGENGVGKSTLVKHFNGMMRPLCGRIMLGGQDLRTMPVSDAARRCAYLGQNPSDYFVKESVAAEIDYSLATLGIDSECRPLLHSRIVADLDLGAIEDRDPRELSGGERMRAALAAVACAEPPLLVLDEPTRGMDPDRKARLAEALRAWAARQRGVLIVTHDVEFVARTATRVLILGADGVLADGPPSDVLDGALFFTTQVNRLLRDTSPGVLLDDDVTWSDA